MKKKFKVGDKIVGTRKANDEYLITCPDNGFVGEIVETDWDDCGSDIKVEVLEANNEKQIGTCHWVDSTYFKRQEVEKIYLASPFFDEEEIKRMEAVRDILREKGLDVFVPNEHQHKDLEFGSREWREATFNSDVKAIDLADAVVAINSKGNYDDSGTMWEIGYAYAKGIPVVVVNLTGETINLMIADSLHALVTSLEELKDYDFKTMPVKEYENYVW